MAGEGYLPVLKRGSDCVYIKLPVEHHYFSIVGNSNLLDNVIQKISPTLLK